MLKTTHLRLGDIWLCQFPKNNGFCLEGVHPCFIIERFGNTVQVFPITGNKSKLRSFEIAIRKGQFNLRKDSKIKLNQWTTISIEKIIRKIGIVDKKVLIQIQNFIQQDVLVKIETAIKNRQQKF